jgi:nucleotide-binding universal stress UspA family protein
MNRILVALDGSDRDRSALGQARRLAPGGTEFLLLHVVPSPLVPAGAPLMGMMDGVPDFPMAIGASGADAHVSAAFPSTTATALEGDSWIHEQALKYLEGLRHRLRDASGQNIVRTGDPAEAILEVALTFNVDLIVMSTHARPRFARWFMGSVSDAVLRRSQLPVLLVRRDLPPPTRRLRRILVPLDASPESRAILSVVKPLAARIKAEILLHEVAGPEEPLHGVGDLSRDLTLSGTACQSVMVHGDATTEILRHAESRDADLIAMAVPARGRSPALDWRVADAVLGHSDRIVLLQHPVIHETRSP